MRANSAMSVRTGAFGAVGFSEGTKRSNDLFGSVEAEREWLASVAALDNLTSAAARTPEQLDAMTSAVQNMVLTSGDAQGAIDQLAGRTAAATRVIDEELTQTLLDAGASAEQIAQRFATAPARCGSHYRRERTPQPAVRRQRRWRFALCGFASASVRKR